MTWTRRFIALLVLAAPVAAPAAPQSFLLLKTGERFATQEMAGPTVAGLTAWLGAKLGGGTNDLAPHVFNDPRAAVEFCVRTPPVAGIVSPGFYLTYGKTLNLEPLLETQRQGVDTERLVVVARRAAPAELTAWEGKTVATALAAEQRYVLGTVLEDKFGQELRLQPTADPEAALLDLAEAAPGAADLVLVEEAAWQTLAKDPDLGPKLKVLFRSAELPHELVVLFRGSAKPLDAAQLQAALRGLGADDAGRKILASIRVREFAPVNLERLNRARELFQGK